MGELVGGVVETVGEEPEPESEDLPEHHEEEEEELTKVGKKRGFVQLFIVLVILIAIAEFCGFR